MGYRLPKVRDRVNIIEKRNYENGKLTTGVVSRLLSNPQEVHPRGNKVELADGTVGRMVSFVDEAGEQTFVDPAEREKYAAEVRQNRPQPVRSPRSSEPRRDNFQRSNDGPRRDFSDRRGSGFTPTPEKPVKLSDLPGEDDLR